MNTMKIKISLIFALTFGLVASYPVIAADNQRGNGPFFGKQAKGKWIIGVKAGKIENNIETVKDADALGIVLGYEFDRPVGRNGTSTIELEYITGDDTNLTLGNGTSYETDVLNLFFTYRSPGTLYLKAKAGLSYSDVELNSFGARATNEDVALALGIGIGYHVGDYGVVELEYSADSGENDIGVLGLNALLEF